MTKKMKVAPAEAAATEPATVELTTSEGMDRPDPTLLGVSVPLSVTFAATKQVMDAWRECFQALSVVVKARLAKSTSVVEAEAPASVIEA